ncbi:oxidoreductase [Bacillus sp. FJAT-27231]|nr:oxidoreductase [Bacillus sp. FJAT-27231]
MKKAVVVGASSGIGEQLARLLSNEGYIVGLVARRKEKLLALQKQLPHESYIKCIDIAHWNAKDLLKEFIEEMEGIDLMVVSAGVGHLNPDLILSLEKETVDVNVSGFIAITNIAYNHFLSKDSGHIVGISSIGALMANPAAPSYNASKTFISNYLVSLRKKFKLQKNNIFVTDVKCGFIDTEMAKGNRDKMFWMAPPEKAALQIYEGIKKKKKTVYVTKRWRSIAWLLKLLFLFN